MMNWWLIVLIVLIPIICIGLAVYTVFYFQSPEDSKSDYVPKAVFVLGMLVALGSVLLVPFDVANAPDPTVEYKFNQTLNTELMWTVVLWIMAALAVVVCPFFLFFYEAWDPDKPRVGKQISHGVIMTIVIVVIFGLIVGLCFWKVGVTILTLQSYTAGPLLVESATGIKSQYQETFVKENMELPASFTTYMIGMLCFFGWILFFFYGGIGILYYPLSEILAFTKRTKAISASRFQQEMAVVLAKADALLEMSTQLQKETRGRISRANKNKVNIIRNEVYLMEAQQDQLIWAYTKAGGSPFIVYGLLILHIIMLGTGIIWIVHIFVYNTFDADPFLNTLLVQLNNAFALCGIVAYGVLAFYLSWSTFQGQIALGLRIIFFQIHPMKYRDTLVNAFLFNASLLLITSFAIIQFVARSFQDYCPYTAINGLMNIYVLNLKGIGQFIRWVQFVFVAMSVIALIFAFLCKKKKRRDPTKVRLNDL